MGGERDHRLRYVGSIGSLFDLVEMLKDTGFEPRLLPGPSPDVTVSVNTGDHDDGLARLTDVHNRWQIGRDDATATFLLRPYGST